MTFHCDCRLSHLSKQAYQFHQAVSTEGINAAAAFWHQALTDNNCCWFQAMTVYSERLESWINTNTNDCRWSSCSSVGILWLSTLKAMCHIYQATSLMPHCTRPTRVGCTRFWCEISVSATWLVSYHRYVHSLSPSDTWTDGTNGQHQQPTLNSMTKTHTICKYGTMWAKSIKQLELLWMLHITFVL